MKRCDFAGKNRLPAIVEEATSSVLIPQDTEASVLDDLGLAVLLEKSGETK